VTPRRARIMFVLSFGMFVVTRDGVLLADAQGSRAATKGLVQAIASVTALDGQLR
jgi:hypothetical protein